MALLLDGDFIRFTDERSTASAAALATSTVPVSAFSSTLALPAGFRNPSVGPGGALIPGTVSIAIPKGRFGLPTDIIRRPSVIETGVFKPPDIGPGVISFPTPAVLAGVPSTKETLEARTNKTTVGIVVAIGAALLLALVGVFK